VIAFRKGAHAEVVQDGATGFLVEDPAGAVQSLQNIASITPGACVQHAQKNFNAGKMAEKYSALYEQLTLAEKTLRFA
jgi:glycosyltransferase involved in cell wall biosynthesis